MQMRHVVPDGLDPVLPTSLRDGGRAHLEHGAKQVGEFLFGGASSEIADGRERLGWNYKRVARRCWKHGKRFFGASRSHKRSVGMKRAVRRVRARKRVARCNNLDARRTVGADRFRQKYVAVVAGKNGVSKAFHTTQMPRLALA